MKKLFYYLGILSALVLFMTSCDDDNNGGPDPQSILEIAQATPDLSTLVDVISDYPDLVSAISSPGTLTVFAPNNAAFAAALSAIGQTDWKDVPEDVLRDILEYHVHTSATLTAATLTDGALPMLNGESATVSTAGGVTIDGAGVAQADVLASNGVVHIIDAVILPSEPLAVLGTIVAPAYFNNDFTILIAAVKAASPSILTTLLGNGPSDMGLTLFAPDNDAFGEIDINTEADLPADAATLDAILTYHVIDGTVGSGDLPVTTVASATVGTLGGNFWLTNKGGGTGVFINGTSEVTATDIAGSNGVVHLINRTLLPPSQTINEIVGDFVAGNPAEFTLLAAALARAGLADFFDGTGPYTVFAPTDAAFLAAGLDEATINATDPAAVAGILTHHVVEANAFIYSVDLADGAVTMLNEQDVTIDVTNLTVQDAAGSTPPANLVPTLLNVQATNGVIHVIDAVLLPN